MKKTLSFVGDTRECVMKLEEWLTFESEVEKPQLNHFIMIAEHSVLALCGTKTKENFVMTCELGMEEKSFQIQFAAFNG